MKYFIHFAIQGISQSMSITANSRNDAYHWITANRPGAEVLCVVPVISEYEFPE